VLLVDADLRRPHVHSIFGSKDHEGLSEILTSSAPTRDLDLKTYIQATQVEGLSVMTHGITQSETPGRLFFSPRVGELVALLQPQFDCVLLDTAPTLPFPDARLWGRHSDGVVLIVRSGVTTREGAATACERFLNDGIPVLGTILNDWRPRDGSKLAEYYYAYGSAPPKKS
jgi:succinoglycan biosynthesis transport protein ExoP